MAVEVPLEAILAVEKAEQAADELRQEIAKKIRQGFKEGAEKSEAEVRKLTDKVVKEMDRVKSEAERAASAAEKLWGMEMIEQYAKGVKLVVGELEILNKVFGETINKAIEFGEVGGKIGGIWGAAIGAGIGAIEAGKDEIEAKEKKRQKERDEALQAQAAFEIGLAGATSKALGKAMIERAKAEEAAAKKAAKAHEEAAKKAIHAWSEAKESAFGGIAGIVGSVVAGVEDTVDKGTTKLKELRDAARAAAREAAAFNGALNRGILSAAEKAQAGQADALAARNQGALGTLDAQKSGIVQLANSWNEVNAAVKEYSFTALLATDKVTKQLSEQQKTALAVAEAWGTHALGGFEKFLDGVQAGNKILGNLKWDEALVNFLRMTGSQLMASGLQHELAAAAAWFLGNKKDAIGLATVGAAELATGAAMGGTGALVGRRRGVGGGRGGDDGPRGGSGGGSLFGGSLSLGKGALGNNAASTSGGDTFVFNLLEPGDRESQERLGRAVAGGLRAFKRAGGRVRDLLDGKN